MLVLCISTIQVMGYAEEPTERSKADHGFNPPDAQTTARPDPAKGKLGVKSSEIPSVMDTFPSPRPPRNKSLRRAIRCVRSSSDDGHAHFSLTRHISQSL